MRYFSLKALRCAARIGLVVFVLAGMAQLPCSGQSAEEAAKVQLPENLLGPAYVDLRNGFSLRPPVSYALGAMASGDLPDLIDWQQLKLPSSKRLVSFSAPDRQQWLTVYLLVTRKDLTIEDIAAARQNYWQTFPEQATVQDTLTESVSNLPAVVTHILWKGKDQGPGIELRETLIQQEKDRYFMLFCGKPSAESVDDEQERLIQTVISNFVCMTEAQIKQRWSEGRQAAQSLLEPLDSAALKDKFDTQIYYRVRLDGQEVGFRCIERKLQVLADQKQHRFKIDALDYLDTSEAAQAYIELIGWQARSLGESVDKPAFIGAIRLESHFQLDGDLKMEQFNFNATDRQQPPNVYCETGEWKENLVSIFPCQMGPESEGAGVEQLKITSKIDKIYLPLSLVDIVGQLIEPKTGQEYVFARYFYRSLGFYSLRVVAKVELKLDRLAVAVEKTESDNNQAAVEKPINAAYLVGQLNSQGPVMEMWLDEQGQVIKQKANGIELIRAERAEIEQRWPKPLAELQSAPAVNNVATK